MVVRAGNQSNSPIELYGAGLSSPVSIASASTGFTILGNSPGISADGSVVVFAGERQVGGVDYGPGIFASVDDGSGSRKLITIAGEYNDPSRGDIPELGYDASGNPINFDPASGGGFDMNSRVAVVDQSDNPTVSAGDSFVVSFEGTPAEASINNPQITSPSSVPLLFSKNDGIWTEA